MKTFIKILMPIMAFLSPLCGQAQSNYEKFVSDKTMQKAGEGLLTIYSKGDDLWLEIPIEAVGRKVMISSTITSGNARGSQVSSNPIYRIEKIDSSIVFRNAAANVVLDGSDAQDEGMKSALEGSGMGAILFTMPVLHYSSDSSSVVIKATKLFDPSSSKVVNLRGIEYGDGAIYTSKYKSGDSALVGIEGFGETVGVNRMASFEYTFTGGNFVFEGKSPMAMDLFTGLTLVPERDYTPRKADGRVGTTNLTYTLFSSDKGSKQEHRALRFGVKEGEKLTIHIDSLLPQGYIEAARKGILAWNEAFRLAGLGDVLELATFSDETTLKDPFKNKINLGGKAGELVRGTRSIDRSSSEILSMNITIPGSYADHARREGMSYIADVDSRYAGYNIPDEAIEELLGYEVMRIMGLMLGLSSNAAGSWAWSPEQLRDPEFTREHGYTASVTDDVRFNTFARPGDKERGLVILQDHVGEYDKFAMEWLYCPDENKLEGILEKARGNEALQYLTASSSLDDPREAAKSLGNDLAAWLEAVCRHFDYAAANAHKWLKEEGANETFKNLYFERLWLEKYNAIQAASHGIGGILTYNTLNGYEKMSCLDSRKQMQLSRKVMEAALEWKEFDANRELLYMTGAYPDITPFSKLNYTSSTSFMTRTAALYRANVLGLTDLTAEDYLKMTSDFVLESLASPKADIGDISMANVYVGMLISMSPTMHGNGKAVHGSLTAIGEDDFAVQLGYAPRTGEADLEAIILNEAERVYDKMKHLKPKTRKGRDAAAYLSKKLENYLSRN